MDCGKAWSAIVYFDVSVVDEQIKCFFFRPHLLPDRPPASLLVSAHKLEHTHIHSDVVQKRSTVHWRGRSMQMCPVSCELIFSLFLFTDRLTTHLQSIHILSITYMFAMPASSSLHTRFTIWRTEPEPLQFSSKRMQKRELIYTYMPLTTKWNCSSHRIAWIWIVCERMFTLWVYSLVLFWICCDCEMKKKVATATASHTHTSNRKIQTPTNRKKNVEFKEAK